MCGENLFLESVIVESDQATIREIVMDLNIVTIKLVKLESSKAEQSSRRELLVFRRGATWDFEAIR